MGCEGGGLEMFKILASHKPVGFRVQRLDFKSVGLCIILGLYWY